MDVKKLIFCFVLLKNVYGNDYKDFETICVSFQPSGYYLLTSWIEDVGSIYSTKEIYETHTKTNKTHTFGWNKNLINKTWHIDIKNITYTHKYIETGISLNECDILSFKQSKCDIWKIQLLNGYYVIEIAVGQPIPDRDEYGNIEKIIGINQTFHYSSTILAENQEIFTTSFTPTNLTLYPSKWLKIGSKIIEVTDNHLRIQQAAGSFGTNIDYVIIKRVACGDIITNFNLPLNAVVSINNYSVYYPSVVQITCEIGYKMQPINLKCNLNGKWEWLWEANEIEGNSSIIQCKKVDCGKIDQSELSQYDAYVYWQEYTYYNSTASVLCNSKDVQFVGELICKETGQWKWKKGFMDFRCPSWTPIKNIKPSVFSQYLNWFIVGIVLGGLLFIFGCLHLYSWMYNKYYSNV